MASSELDAVWHRKEKEKTEACGGEVREEQVENLLSRQQADFTEICKCETLKATLVLGWRRGLIVSPAH